MTQKVPLDLNQPFVVTRTPNGGYLLEQQNLGMFAPAPPVPMNQRHPGERDPYQQSKLLAAYSSADDLLRVLTELLNPPAPVSELITEEPPHDMTNHPDEWMDMSMAPRTGVYVRLEDENGTRYRPMKFTQPGWWDAPNGELRLADYNGSGDVLRAVKWRPLSAEENQQYNGRKPKAGVPEWGR